MSFKPLALISALLLVGCNDDLMTLRFEDSAGSSGTGLDARKQQMIDEALVQRQIDPKSLRWRVDLEDQHLVYVRELQPLSEAQRKALREPFDEILQARAANTLQIELTLDITPEQRQALSAAERQRIDALPQPLLIPLELSPTVLTMALMPRDDDNVPRDVTERINSKVTCQLQALPVKPLPEGITGLWQMTLDTANQVSVELGEAHYPAHYRLTDAGLQGRIDKGELWLVEPNYLSVDPLVVMLGFSDLGQQRLYRSFPLQPNASQLIHSCESAANHLPRPLSFRVGDGLDRLESVTYKEETQ